MRCSRDPGPRCPREWGKRPNDTSSRTGQRLVIVLKRDAVARVVLNNLLKHTELQTNFSANMLALVDGVPRTLNLAQFLRYYVEHQIDVIRRAYAPTPDEEAWARRVLDAAGSERGVFDFEGKMVDAPVLRHAERLLQRAAASTPS